MVQRAVDLEYPALAVTDHGVSSGHLKLQHACNQANIKPIFGQEGYFKDSRWEHAGKKGEFYNHLSMWALNDKGLENLWTLSTLGFTEGLWYGDPQIDWELLEKHNEGLAISTGCLSGATTRFLNPERGYDLEQATERIGRFLKIFGDRYYVEIHAYQSDVQKQVNQELIGIAQQYSLPLIAVSDSHYLEGKDWFLHEAVTAIGMGRTMQDEKRMQHGPDQLALYSEQEIKNRLSYLPSNAINEAINNTVSLAERCTASIKEELHMPVFFGSAKDDQESLKEFAAEGFQARIIDKVPEERHGLYFDRLDYELNMILDKGFAGYFLMVMDTVNWSKQHGLLIGPGRGSAAGSLLAYCLGITEVDPIKYDLIFERFLDLEKVSLPDIDLDFPDDERSLTRTYLEDKYGATNIATIGTFDKVGLKTAIRDLCRVLVIPIQDMNEILKIVDPLSNDAASTIDTIKELAPWIKQYPLLFQYIPQYVGHIRQASTHAGGVVISKDSLLGRLPLYTQKAGDSELRIQFDMKDVESMGYVKMDHLGIRNLSTLMKAYKLIKERHPDANLPYYYNWEEEQYEDEEVWDSICDGHNIGLFQLESNLLSNAAPRFKPRSLNDLAAMIAAYRPGLMDAVDPDTGLSMIEVYLRRKERRLAVQYPHPLLEPVLKKTYGTFLYQESVLQGVKVIAGYSLKDADRLRRIIGKKLPEEMKKERDIFVKGCWDANQIEEHEANVLFDELEAHQRYSFNFSHAISYAMVAFWTAFIKHYWPHEFMLACMRTDPDNIIDYCRECDRLGINVLNPDINESQLDFSLDDNNNIRFGLHHMKWGPSSKDIERLQPFSSLEDLAEKTDIKILPKRAVESLAMVGAVSPLLPGAPPSQILHRFWEIKGTWKKLDVAHVLPKQQPCPLCAGTKTEFECWAAENDVDNMAKNELDLMGLIISSNPLEEYLDLIEKEATYHPSVEYFRNERIKAGGLIIKSESFAIKNGKNKGKMMGKILLQAPAYSTVPASQIELVAFPGQYDIMKEDMKAGLPVFVVGSKLDNGFSLQDLIRLDQL